MWFLRSIIVVLAASHLVCLTNAYRILGLFSHPGKSHGDVFVPLLKGLARRGHQVTVVSYYPLREAVPNYRDIPIVEHPNQLLSVVDVRGTFARTRLRRYAVAAALAEYADEGCRTAYGSRAVQQFLKGNDTFDLVITEFFNSDCLLGFLHRFNNPPLVGLSSCVLMGWSNERVANPWHPAYIPNNLMDYSDRMTFFERVENTLVGMGNQIFFDSVMNANDERIARRLFGADMPPLHTAIRNTSLILVNSHFSLNFPRPLVPAVVEVGGIHIGKPKKLPFNIEKWINESAHGVIYFSLGSMIKGHTFPEEKRQEFLKAFGRLPQRVLWKWENDSMPGKPDNVMIQKWMPQFDILCHPNVRAFISHGGLLGTTEAVHCGVPVIVMPQYGDQFTNAKALEANGGGVILHLREANEEKVYNALKTVLDPTFRAKARQLSARFKDRPLPPLETAIYWVEYVARHGGAHHMRSAAVDLPFYQYLLLDVIAFLLVVFAALTALSFYAVKYVFRRLFPHALFKLKSD